MKMKSSVWAGVLAFAASMLLTACGSGNIVTSPALTLNVAFGLKQLQFSWAEVAGADVYRLLENPDGASGYHQVGADLPAGTTSTVVDIAVHRQNWSNALYMVQACNADGCSDSAAIDTITGMLQAIGYVKAGNTAAGDAFGVSVALSGDGATLAVGAQYEGGAATGINGALTNDCDAMTPINCASGSGAVYIYTLTTGGWRQTPTYIKASNTGAGDAFGSSVALSTDGNTLAVGAYGEDSAATGVNGTQTEICSGTLVNCANNSGAAYVYTRGVDGVWSGPSYIKASNTGAGDSFGVSVALSGDGDTLVVGASQEGSAATGIDGAQADDCVAATPVNCAAYSGAAYVYTRTTGVWSQTPAYVKASNTGASDAFGSSVALSADGNTLAVGASQEDSAATGVGGAQADDCVAVTPVNCANGSGAVYIYTRTTGSWGQVPTYVKASNTGAYDFFGVSVALSADGNTLAIGARGEDSAATGVNGTQVETCGALVNCANNSGAAYVYTRMAGGAWSGPDYIKASNSDAFDFFGQSVVLNADGNTLVVGAYQEDSVAAGIDGEPYDNQVYEAGAVYTYSRTAGGAWSDPTYIKASNTSAHDSFGISVALSDDGNTLAIGARGEDGAATGVNGAQANDCGAAISANCAAYSGAVYLY